MAEAVVISIAEDIVGYLVPRALDYVGKFCGVKREIEVLKKRVVMLQAVLDDAEEKYYQNQNPQNRQIRVWLQNVKDAFYEVQDVLEEFDIEAIRRDLRGRYGMCEEVRTFFSSSNQLVFKLKMTYQIRTLSVRIEAIKTDGTFYYLEERPKREWRKREETHSFVRGEDIIGRDRDKKKVMDFLLDSNFGENVSILPIVGIGGLGKTALAQYVYGESKFDLKMWVCVSTDFDVKKIVKKMLACAKRKEPEEDTMDLLQSNLRAEIDRKKYLLVLDDVWDVMPETWLSLKTLLVGGARGSKILITTRLNLITKITSTAQPHFLGGLSDGASLKLLMQMAGRKIEEQDSNMLAIGKDIVRKCAGVPLVVRTIGHLLFSKETEREWLRFKDDELLEVSKGGENILSVLRLSYNHLPPHLKQCFAFCSLFPKDYVIKKQTLVDLWMAEGFIQPSNGHQHLEDIAHEYFMELLWSNFFQDFKEKVQDFKVEYLQEEDEETCKMHDLMHDLACSVAGTECWVAGDDKKPIHEKTRHISRDFTSNLMGKLPISWSKASALRTYLYAPKYEEMVQREPTSEANLQELIQSFKRLRILDLHDTNVEKVPMSICKLKHLTYLDLSYNKTLNLSYNKTLKRLPNCITRLQNLQTLNLNYCSWLEELPNDIGKLISLRNLYIDGCTRLSYMPCGLGQLSSLHRLTNFILPKDKALAKNCGGLEELNGLNNIRGILHVRNLGSVTDAVAESNAANLIEKPFLEFLILQWYHSDTDDAITKNRDEALLDGLRPHKNLQRLTIIGYNGESVPSWMADMPDLVMLSLVGCSRCKHFPPFGLNKLKHLKISEAEFLECLPEEFLKSLTSLESLKIEDCPRLTSLALGLRHLSKLVDLSIVRCKELDLSKDENGNIIISDLHGGLQNLRSLGIYSLPKPESLPQWLLQARNLEDLDIFNCNNLRALPERIEALQSLQRLHIQKCDSLTSLPEGMGRLASLTRLSIWGCEELDLSKEESGNIILDFHGGLQSLRYVEFRGIPKLESLPQWLLQARNLEELEIWQCGNLKALPEQIEALQSLQRLEMGDCDSLMSLPEGMRGLASLMHLRILRCKELDLSKDERGTILDFHGGLQSLRSLEITLLPKVESLPPWLLQLSNLEHLEIRSCRNFKELPEQIEALQSLQELQISSCHSLTSLPEGMRRLTSLTRLKIIDCPELEERCKRDVGEDWHKIAHIPN